jgi:methylated-DNA-[protein]-cysteine S-methyltransferase
METLYYSRFDSQVGPLFVAVSERGLVALEFDLDLPKKRSRIQWVESVEKTRPHIQQLEEYFAGQRREFTLPLDLRGTEFQKRCWGALLKIPYGQTCTYADIARAVGSERAFRAVGMANHDNPVAIVVPCHRVIASDGTLGGYGGGLDIKRKLLELEQENQQRRNKSTAD